MPPLASSSRVKASSISGRTRVALEDSQIALEGARSMKHFASSEARPSATKSATNASKNVSVEWNNDRDR